MKSIALFFVTFIIFSAGAVPKNLPVPRFVSIKFNEVNARTGPNKDCPIEWVFVKKGEPVEVVAEYDQWRKIRDIKGEGGWVHSSVISGNRFVALVSSDILPLISAPGEYDKIVAKLSPNMRCKFLKCQKDWCKINCQSYKGWVSRKFLWGVYPDE